jgi:outer membrane receptor protein involved in Fe transport
MFKNAKINLLIASLFSVTAYTAELTTDKIDVISTTPLPGIGLDINKIPSNVQYVKGSELKRTQSLDLTDYMNRNLTGVYINEVQNNPVMPDVSYRGFTASPLLGTPQGISVYMDGVRMNQPFGDQVSWDLIPKNAINNMQLMPGSNPMFGLNTLGGALSIQTKDGRNSPGGAMQVTAGSYGRKIGEFEYGGVSKDNSVDYFIAGTYFDENGWREKSNSDFGQLFSKLGWKGDKTDIKLTYAHANTDLNGNGLSPQSQLASKYNSVFTYPDNNQNKSHLLNLQLAHYFTDKLNFTGNTYYRNIKNKTYNGDINDGAMPEMPGSYGQTMGHWYAGGRSASANGTTWGAHPELNGRFRYDCETQGLAQDEPTEKCPGAINRTQSRQHTFGLFGQVNGENQLFNLKNNYVVGGGFETTRTKFDVSREYADIINRQAIGFGYMANGSIALDEGGTDDARVNLRSKNRVWSIFGSDTVELTNKLALTASARYNYMKVNNNDQINPAGQSDSLSGDHVFNRINPAVGLTFSANESLTVYGGYNEGSRAPSSIELGCANPDAPCRLPNSMAGDPPLNQVVTKTWEAGLRGKYGQNFSWNGTVFQSNNHNDIQFVAAGSTGQGYFRNFGETRRRGFEGSMFGSLDKFNFGANYTYLNAEYRSVETLPGNNNSSATLTDVERYRSGTAGNYCLGAAALAITGGCNYPTAAQINISKGDNIPLIPDHIFKVFSDYSVSDKFKLGGDMIVVAGSFVRGNENNKHQPGSVTWECDDVAANGENCKAAYGTSTYRGQGKIPGYATMNLFASYKPHNDWTIFGRLNNVFDKEYYTAGQLGADPFNGGGVIQTNPTGVANKSFTIGDTFVAPGAPRSLWVGVRYEFDGKK